MGRMAQKRQRESTAGASSDGSVAQSLAAYTRSDLVCTPMKSWCFKAPGQKADLPARVPKWMLHLPRMW